MKLLPGKRPESVADVLAALLLIPAIFWIISVCWLFGGNREARKAWWWMFGER